MFTLPMPYVRQQTADRRPGGGYQYGQRGRNNNGGC